MARTARTRNDRFAAAMAEAGWTYDTCAAAIRAVALENGVRLASCNRSYVSHWIAGVRPKGQTMCFISEAFSRRLGYPVRPADLGFDVDGEDPMRFNAHGWWNGDPVADLVTVGRTDMHRREVVAKAVYSLAALAVPSDAWKEISARGAAARSGAGHVGRGEVDAVREMTSALSRADERFGGGSGRQAAVAYLTTDVAAYLRGTFDSGSVRREMFSAAAELTYLVGWKCFDSAEHGLAQTYYLRALRLAGEAGDRGLGAFILRAMAHQAVDLGHGRTSVNLADSSLDWAAAQATPGLAALLAIVKARGHAAQDESVAALSEIRRAETSLHGVDWSTEPGWLGRAGGFDQASLANQIAQCLRDLGDLAGAEAQFRQSVAARNGVAHRRIHALTLANLADVEFSRGAVAAACQRWNAALDHMHGVQSGRASQAVRNIRTRLSSLGPRSPAVVRELDRRASAVSILQGGRH